MQVDGRDVQTLKEVLYRVEAERLRLQRQANELTENKQQLTNDVVQLRQQLTQAHAAVAAGQQQALQLTRAQDRLQVQVAAATAEYQANDIIAIGLRDNIARLQQELQSSQTACAQQAAEIADLTGGMAVLRHSNADLNQQLGDLQQQHHHLQQDYAITAQKLAEAQQESVDMRKHWMDEHGGQVRQLEAVQHARQQAEQRVAELKQQSQQQQQELLQQRARCAELEGELTHIRELVVLLGKAMGRLPGLPQLPSHDDPAWCKLGPSGAVSFALDTVIKHTREQHVRVKELQMDCDRLKDQLHAESSQKADLQTELYTARTLYAKAVSVREALEAQASRAEAEKAAAETSLQQSQSQAEEDGGRIRSLQEQLALLSQQVQSLLLLQPKLSTAEAERDTALHSLEQIQEQHVQVQRQLQEAVTREAGLQAEVEAYKLEHSHLLTVNTQLVKQCSTLNDQLQVLEIEVREGNLVKEQLEDAKRRLSRSKTQLQAMADRNVETLNRLESTKELLTSGSGYGGRSSSRPASAWSRSSRPATANTQVSGLQRSTSSSPKNSPRDSNTGVVQAAHQMARAPSATAVSRAHLSVGFSSSGADDVDAREIGALPTAGDGGDEELQRSAMQDIDDILRQRELERLVEDQEQELLSLQEQLQQQQVQIAELEVQLLQQEASHVQELHASGAAVSAQCMSAAGEALGVLQTAWQDLHMVLKGPAEHAGDDPSGATSSWGTSDGTLGDHLHTAQYINSSQQQHQHQQPGRQRWLGQVTRVITTTLQRVVEEAQARAQLIASRQHVAVQSDEAVQVQWLAFINSLPEAVVPQPLHHKAASEAILRIYLRGLSQLEAAHSTHKGSPRPPAAAAGPAGFGASSGGALSLFDLVMAHYTPPAPPAQQQRRASVQTYSAALWQDPQGPITRLLVSCRSLAAGSVKVALFCCLVGTHRPASSKLPWGQQHWQQFLLLLHAVKHLTGGLWKGLLREWAAAAGAFLPLQCAFDLVGNLYNVSSCAALEQQPAVLGSRELLLGAVQVLHVQVSTKVSRSRPGTAGDVGSGGPRVTVGDSGTAASEPQLKQEQNVAGGWEQQQQQQVGSAAAALRQLAVDGPLGPASVVDLDDLMALLMVQFDAGMLPLHPLLRPRRLTTGELGNATNAWGSAATEAVSGALSRRSAAGLLVEVGEPRRPPGGDWGLPPQPDSPSALSTASGGWYSRPTTAASRTSTAASGMSPDRPSTAVAGSAQAAAGSSVTVTLTLPRIKTPEGGFKDAVRSTSAKNVAQQELTGRSGAGALIGAAAASSSAVPSLASRKAPSITRGLSMARVSFVEPDMQLQDK